MSAIELWIDEDAPEPVIHRGTPPQDQSALVTSLQADLAARTTERDKLQGKLDSLKANAEARKAADAQKVDGQDDLDIINAP